MAAVCILDEFEVHKNEKFFENCREKLKPELHETYNKAKETFKV